MGAWISARAISLAILAPLLFTRLHAQDAREIVRKSVVLDQANYRHARDYTWKVRHVESQLDSNGKVKSSKEESWETTILYGEPHRKFVERNNKPLSPEELRKQQEKLDSEVAKLRDETPEQRQRRLAKEAREQQKNREFLLEIPEIYNLRIEREDQVDGRPVWVISALPKQGYRPKHSDAKDLQKIKGTLWIDKAEYQWVRVEAETIGTISYGLFIARISPGSKLLFEQTRVNNEVWLPKRSRVTGSGRLLGKKIVIEDDATWSDFRKFRVESNIIVD